MIHFNVSNERQSTEFDHQSGVIEFGRAPADDGSRFVIEDRYVSRCQLRVEQVSDRQIRIDNLGQPFTLPTGATIAEGNSEKVELPFRFKVGYTTIDITTEVPVVARDTSLQTIAPPMRVRKTDEHKSSLKALGSTPDPATLARWFETVLSVQRSAAGTDAFYDETARAVVELVGLDSGMVIMREKNDWQIKSFDSFTGQQSAAFSRSILNQVLTEKRTMYRSPDSTNQEASLALVESVVASPIFDAGDQVVGIVYGARSLESTIQRSGVTPLEAQVVQLLAGAVSAGLARMEREAEAARNRARFEQFASPELARELERNPNLLDGTDREITVMFSDIRSFSRISERLGARETSEFVEDVMDRLTTRILEHEGIIIDYHGDGMAAMWNAPVDQPRHADMACRAALAMLAETSELNDRWQARLEMPVKFGIGINSGSAQVGNAGSSRRPKYGPRGHTVNVASRVEGATKQVGVPILITKETRARLGDEFATRRLCKIRVVGIEGAVEVFELHGATADPEWLKCCEKYEEALTLYEGQRSLEASSILQQLLDDPDSEDDAPSRMLSSYIFEKCDSSVKYDPSIKLDSK
jgi:adenylate cyclase